MTMEELINKITLSNFTGDTVYFWYKDKNSNRRTGGLDKKEFEKDLRYIADGTWNPENVSSFPKTWDGYVKLILPQYESNEFEIIEITGDMKKSDRKNLFYDAGTGRKGKNREKCPTPAQCFPVKRLSWFGRVILSIKSLFTKAELKERINAEKRI